MMREPNKRPRRILFTSEELSHMIAYRKHRERLLVLKFKKTKAYKALNILNICCIFIFLEVLSCYFGPSDDYKHYSWNTQVNYGRIYKEDGTPIVSEIDVFGVDGTIYRLEVEEFIEIPDKRISFIVGKDFLIRKDLKAALETNAVFYRLFSASPILFLCLFAAFINFAFFLFNLNESLYPLCGLVFINTFTVFGIMVM